MCVCVWVQNTDSRSKQVFSCPICYRRMNILGNTQNWCFSMQTTITIHFCLYGALWSRWLLRPVLLKGKRERHGICFGFYLLYDVFESFVFSKVGW
ncbi:hypothetical protein F4703DRAFT_1818422 [Phycomyces blakesleeanus]